MKKTKRPALLAGLTIITFIIALYILSYISRESNDILETIVFIVALVIFFVNVKSFYTVNLSAKEFKKQMYLPWISFGLTLIYSLFMLIVTIINSDNGLDRDELLTSALVIIVWLGLLLYIPGILTKIIDDKITYEEHINKNK